MDVAIISPSAPGVAELLVDSDVYMSRLYPAESNHLTDMRTLSDPATTLVGAFEDGRAIACGALVRQDRAYAELKRMFVSECARGKGHGKAILRKLVAIAEAEGLSLRLETGIRQPEAIGLYRPHGFEEIEAFAPYGRDPLSMFMMRKAHRVGKAG